MHVHHIKQTLVCCICLIGASPPGAGANRSGGANVNSSVSTSHRQAAQRLQFTDEEGEEEEEEEDVVGGARSRRGARARARSATPGSGTRRRGQ